MHLPSLPYSNYDDECVCITPVVYTIFEQTHGGLYVIFNFVFYCKLRYGIFIAGPHFLDQCIWLDKIDDSRPNDGRRILLLVHEEGNHSVKYLSNWNGSFKKFSNCFCKMPTECLCGASLVVPSPASTCHTQTGRLVVVVFHPVMSLLIVRKYSS